MPIATNNIIVADGAGGFVGARGTIDSAGNFALPTGATMTLNQTTIALSDGSISLAGTSFIGGAWRITAAGVVTGSLDWHDRQVYEDAIALGAFLVADLPAANEGDVAYATDGCKVGEPPGSGTGVPVYASQGIWLVFSTDQPATA